MTAQDAKGNVSQPSNQASAAPFPAAVPDVVNQTQAFASTTLTGSGLVVGTVTTASHGTILSGRVIEQNPVAGMSVSAGSAVALVVSTGLPPVPVPNVTGMTQSDASSALNAWGLKPGAITLAPSVLVASGSVISQLPLAGAGAAPGSAVALTISTGLPAATIQIANVQSTVSNTSSNTITLAYTVPNMAGQALMLVVEAGSEASTTGAALPVSATFNGRTLTRAAAIRTPASGTNNGSGLFWMPVSANETGTIQITFTGTCIEKGIGALTLAGADLTGPTVVETATGTASLTDVITTSTPGALVISTAMQGNAGTLTATGTGHLRDFTVAAASSQIAGGRVQTTAPGTLTIGYSASNINRIAMVLAVFSIPGTLVVAPDLSGRTQNDAQSVLAAQD